MHEHNALSSSYCLELTFDDTKNISKLAPQLSTVLQNYCYRLSPFFQKETLAAFASKMCEAGIITTELRDNPVYNTIEGQFTATLTILDTKEEYETCCKDFLNALKSQGKALERFEQKIKEEWIAAGRKLQINLSL